MGQSTLVILSITLGLLAAVICTAGCVTDNQSADDKAAAVRPNGIFVGTYEEKTGAASFTGIPFAKQPDGKLRWKAPQALNTSTENIYVGIAWIPDAASSMPYQDTCRAVREAGGIPVLLGEVYSGTLRYEGGHLSSECQTKGRYLTADAAETVKAESADSTNALEVLRNVDAVIFAGGEDISPTLYLESPNSQDIVEIDFNAERDVSDYLLMKYCLEHDIPTLAVCRGMQMLCVVSGGKLIPDIPAYFSALGREYHFEHRNAAADSDGYRDFAPTTVTVTNQSSLLYQITGKETLTGCPCWHHQAVSSVDGTSVIVTGVSETSGINLIEVLECPDKTFLLGVQFHPETAVVKHLDGKENADRFMDIETALSFFGALLDAAKEKSES